MTPLLPIRTPVRPADGAPREAPRGLASRPDTAGHPAPGHRTRVANPAARRCNPGPKSRLPGRWVGWLRGRRRASVGIRAGLDVAQDVGAGRRPAEELAGLPRGHALVQRHTDGGP